MLTIRLSRRKPKQWDSELYLLTAQFQLTDWTKDLKKSKGESIFDF
jgi:hypothetical protein